MTKTYYIYGVFVGKTITARVDEKTEKDLKKAAIQLGLNESEVIRLSIALFVRTQLEKTKHKKIKLTGN